MSGEQAFTGLAEIEEREGGPILGGEGGSRRCACGAPKMGDEVIHRADVCRVMQGPPVIERAPFPAALVSSRVYSEESACPSPAQGLAARARAAGWLVKVQGSVGHTPHATTGRPSAAAKALWGVVMRSADGLAGAYAVYEQGAASWKSVMLWGRVPHFPYASVTELGEYLAAGGRMEPSWYAGIRRRVGTAEARRKAAAKARPASGKKEGMA